MNSGRILISSILAGVMISISSIAYLNTIPVVGSFIFAVGLLSILHFKLDLFTGKVPYITTCMELPYILTVLTGNVIGCCIMFAFPTAVASQVISSALTVYPVITFLKAMLCNVLIYIAVESYKKSDILTVILSIAAFVIAGFDHSVARICFIISARVFNYDVVKYILIVILGNAFGGIIFHRLREKIHK